MLWKRRGVEGETTDVEGGTVGREEQTAKEQTGCEIPQKNSQFVRRNTQKGARECRNTQWWLEFTRCSVSHSIPDDCQNNNNSNYYFSSVISYPLSVLVSLWLSLTASPISAVDARHTEKPPVLRERRAHVHAAVESPHLTVINISGFLFPFTQAGWNASCSPLRARRQDGIWSCDNHDHHIRTVKTWLKGFVCISSITELETHSASNLLWAEWQSMFGTMIRGEDWIGIAGNPPMHLFSRGGAWRVTKISIINLSVTQENIVKGYLLSVSTWT